MGSGNGTMGNSSAVPSRTGKVLAVLKLIASGGVIFHAVSSIINSHMQIHPVVDNIFLGMLGALLLSTLVASLAEKITRYFGFLGTTLGVGVFMVYLGMQCAGSFDTDSYEAWLGIGLCGIGVIFILLHFCGAKDDARQPLLNV